MSKETQAYLIAARGLLEAEGAIDAIERRSFEDAETSRYELAVRELCRRFLVSRGHLLDEPAPPATFVNPPHAHLQPEGPGTGGP